MTPLLPASINPIIAAFNRIGTPTALAVTSLATSTCNQHTKKTTAKKIRVTNASAKMTTGVFQYFDPTSTTSKPWAKVDTGAGRSYQQVPHTRPVSDIRSAPASFGTDISGFALHHSPSSVPTPFAADATVRDAYYPEIEAILRAHLPGAPGPAQKIKKVVIFDHTIRKHDPTSPRQPVQSVHVDQTPGAAAARVRRHIADPAEAEELLKGRYQIVNVWRPLNHPATDFPLALVDWRTTQPKDLVAVDLLYPIKNRTEGDNDDRGKEVLPDPEQLTSTEGYEVKGETYGVAPSEKHRFWYVKDMTPEEVLFIKCFDSRAQGLPGGREGVAALTPHTAFIDPQTPEGTKGRESIEVRCLVFYED